MRPDKKKLLIGLEPFKKAISRCTKSQNLIAIDLETTGLKLHLDKITWVSWATADAYGAVPILHRNPFNKNKKLICKNEPIEEVKNLVRDLHLSSRWKIIYHNAKFDLSMMIASEWVTLDDLNDDRIIDTMLASFTINPVKSREMGGGSHSLKALYDELLRDHGEDDPQPDFQTTTGGRSFQDLHIEDAAWYAAFDAWTTFHAWSVLEMNIRGSRNHSHYYFKIEIPHLLTTVEIVTTGMTLQVQNEVPDGWKIQDLHDELEQTIQEIYCITRRSFQFSSPDALRYALFFSDVDLAPRGRGKDSNKYSVDKLTLIDIFSETPDQWKRLLLANTLYAKYLDNTIKKHEEMYSAINSKSQRIYPNVRPTTASGRYSCPSPNVLSLSRSSKIKDRIIPSKPDRSFVVADFSQIDLRVIANEAAEINPNSQMYKDVNSGRDLHFNTVTIISSEAKDKAQNHGWFKISKDGEVKDASGQSITLNSSDRALAKSLRNIRDGIAKEVNFGVSYGLGPSSLMASLNKNTNALDELIDLRKNEVKDKADQLKADSHLPEWFKKMNKHYEDHDYCIKWVEQLNKEIEADGDTKKWLDAVDGKLKDESEKVSIDQVKKYFDDFGEAYPDIEKFQDLVKDHLERSGITSNLFGRICRSEIAPHLSGGIHGISNAFNMAQKASVDVKVSKEKWFRVGFLKVGLDKQNLYCVIHRVARLEVTEPNKYNVKIRDIKVEEKELVYEVSLSEIVKTIAAATAVGDKNEAAILCERLGSRGFDLDLEEVHQWLSGDPSDIDPNDFYDSLNLLHHDGFFDADNFFDVIKPIVPMDIFIDCDNPTIKGVELPTFPFAAIPHMMIKKVLINFPKTKAHITYIGHDKLRRNLISSRVSSTSMDFCKISMFVFRRKAKELWPDQNDRPRIVNCIHDEIAVECLTKDEQKVHDLLMECMTHDVSDPTKSVFVPFIYPGRKLRTSITAEAKCSNTSYSKAKP